MSNQTFDFSEALRRMKEGKKVRRKGKESTYRIKGSTIEYLLFDAEDEDGIIPLHDLNPYTVHEGILATDWEEVEV